MEVDVLPPAVPAVPYPGLLRLAGARTALPVDKLRQADVGDAGGVVSDHVHVRVEDGGVDGLAVLGEDWRQRQGSNFRPQHFNLPTTQSVRRKEK